MQQQTQNKHNFLAIVLLHVFIISFYTLQNDFGGNGTCHVIFIGPRWLLQPIFLRQEKRTARSNRQETQLKTSQRKSRSHRSYCGRHTQQTCGSNKNVLVYVLKKSLCGFFKIVHCKIYMFVLVC